MEQKDKDLLDYCNLSVIKKIAYFGEKIHKNILSQFDNSYFEFVKIKDIDDFFILTDYDLLILPFGYKEKFKNEKIFCLYYDDKNIIDFGISNKEIFKNFSQYKDKYFINDYFFDIIKGFEINKKIFGDIYIKYIELDRFKICFSIGLEIYLETGRQKDFYYNFGKIQMLVNTEKLIFKNDKLISELLLKIIIKKISNNLLKI